MRVLTVGNMYPPHHLGGYELVWQGAVDHMRAVGHEVTVLTTTTRLRDDVPDDPAHVRRELRWFWADHAFPPVTRDEAGAVAAHDLRALDRELVTPPDAVVWFSMGGLPLLLIDRVADTGLPSLAVVHDAWPIYGPEVDRSPPTGAGPWWTRLGPRSPAGRRARRATGLPRVDRVSFNSTYMRDEVHRRVPRLDRARSVVDPPGVELDRLRPAPAAGWRGRLLVIGRLDPRKGIDDALRALSRLDDVTTVLRVVGGGDPGELRRLVALAADLGVADRVTFAPSTDDVGAEYAWSDAVLFPVVWDEPFGLVPLEAMATGRPVVATARGGAVEFLEDGVNALVVAPHDADALAVAVRRLAHDRALRERLVAGGRVTVATRSRRRFTAAIANHVAEVAGAPRAATVRDRRA